MSAVHDEIIITRWPNIEFGDSGRARFAEVAHLLDELDARNHPHAEEIRAEFVRRLDYLDAYGGPVSETDPRRRFRTHLEKDWAPYSFSIVWNSLDKATSTYAYAFNGGLIWHGGPGDPLTVTLTPTWFGIHS